MDRPATRQPLGVGIDTGGTFTDIVEGHVEAGRLVEPRVRKVLSTPDDPSRAIVEGLARTGAWGAADRVVHGTTVATNALLERRGARTVLVTTRGFGDVLDLARQDRPHLHDIRWRPEETVVPRELRIEVDERIGAGGEVVLALDDAETRRVVRDVEALAPESIAVGLLFSPENVAHERTLRDALRELGVPVVASSDLLPEIREYERFSTTSISAYVAPVLRRALGQLEAHLDPAALGIMDSAGGVRTASVMGDEAARAVLSGPAGGAVAAKSLCTARGRGAVAFDMGGTSTDVSVIAPGRIPMTHDFRIHDQPVALPTVDVHTVGAGGGSIAWRDAGGALRVGPRSSGADPGPIAYGRGGTEATVSDAQIMLGRLPAGVRLGGDFELDEERLRAQIGDRAAEFSMSPREYAFGIVRVVVAEMARAVRRVTQERGHDPRELDLLSFGGAGGLHAVDLARELGMTHVVCPPAPGVFSAAGMLLAPPVRTSGGAIVESWSSALGEQIASSIDAFASSLAEPERVNVIRELELRLLGQSHGIDVPWSPGEDPRERFTEAYRRRFGVDPPHSDIEVVCYRVRAEAEPVLCEFPTADLHDESDRREKTVVALDAERDAEALFVSRAAFERGGEALAGPAIIAERTSTLWIPPGATATAGSHGEIVVEVRSAEG